MPKESTKTIAQNKKAYHDYFVTETIGAGIEVCGTEVKSLREGRVNLKDSWCCFNTIYFNFFTTRYRSCFNLFNYLFFYDVY